MQDRYKQAMIDLRRRQLNAGGTFGQADAISRHYASLAVEALRLGKLVELVRHGGGDLETKKVITAMVENIKAIHLQDFGIELEWEDRLLVVDTWKTNEVPTDIKLIDPHGTTEAKT